MNEELYKTLINIGNTAFSVIGVEGIIGKLV